MLSLAAQPIAAAKQGSRPTTSVLRYRRSLLLQSHRELSSVPHHLARKNNSWVNGFVKSIKVPRPIIVANSATPPRKPSRIETILHAVCYVGNDSIPITNELQIVVPGVDDVPRGTWPVFRMMVS